MSIEGTGIVGEGDVINLDVLSSTTDLEPGTYEYTGTEEGGVPFDLWDGSVYLDWNTQDESELTITGGTMKVSKSGDTYTIDFDGVSGETTIKIHYTGTVTKILKDQLSH